MNLPLKIKVNSDNNELEFQSTIKGFNIYKYLKSETKKGQLIGWTDAELTKLLTNKIITNV